MIYSTYHNKNTNEDPKTSTVFGNLMLLPDNVFWNILKVSAANKGVLPEDAGLMADNYSFWPKWNPNLKYDTGNSNYVEPDVFFRFENIDVIVEAKYSDNGGQYREEWEREFKAYLNEFESNKKKVILLAVGGNSTFKREPDIEVDKHKCPIVKYSWYSLLEAVLAFEKEELSNIENEKQSSMKRIIRNVEFGFQNLGIYKYNKKVELKGLSNLYALGKVFQSATKRETESYTLSNNGWDLHNSHYGIFFNVSPKDTDINEVTMSIALWINEGELIIIGINQDYITGQINNVSFPFKYAKKPYWEDKNYYFDAGNKFYQEFNEAETFDAQVEIVSKYIDEVYQFWLNTQKK